MKKTAIILVAQLALAVGAMAQGSISGIGSALNSGAYGWFVTGVGNQQAGSGYLVGGLTATIYFSTSATAGIDTTIDNLNGTAGGGAAAQALFSADGFEQAASTITGLASTSGSGSTGWSGSYTLGSTFASSAIGSYAIVFTGTGAFANYSSVVAWTGNYGGNPAGSPPGTAYNAAPGSAPFSGLQNFANAANVDLTTTAVPEPAMMAMAGLGGLSLLAFRRRK
jgi:hypothetical protein